MLLLAVACDDDNAAPDPPEETVALTPVGGTGNAPACGSGQPAADSTRTLTHGGLQRSYILHVPDSYSAAERVPLVVNLHGRGSNGVQQAVYSRLNVAADEHGFIVVTPDGTGEGRQLGWALLPGGVDDLGFVGALIDEIEAELCIDPKAIFAAGISNGSALAQQLACAMPGRIAGVIAVAAAVYPVRCANVDVAVGIVLFHGTEDAVVPYGGGISPLGLPVRPVVEVADAWARHNGCAGEPTLGRHGTSIAITSYEGCNDGVPVVLFTVEGGGHTWPGSADVPRLGPTTREIDATEVAAQLITGQSPLPPD